MTRQVELFLRAQHEVYTFDVGDLLRLELSVTADDRHERVGVGGLGAADNVAAFRIRTSVTLHVLTTTTSGRSAMSTLA